MQPLCPSGTVNPERCQSGRLGRSRKPLSGQLDRGFESLSLRKVQECQAVSDGLVSVLWSATSLLAGEERDRKQNNSGARRCIPVLCRDSSNGITAGNPSMRSANACIVSCRLPKMGSPQVIPSNTLKSKPKFCLFYTHFISLDAAMNLIKLT